MLLFATTITSTVRHHVVRSVVNVAVSPRWCEFDRGLRSKAVRDSEGRRRREGGGETEGSAWAT